MPLGQSFYLPRDFAAGLLDSSKSLLLSRKILNRFIYPILLFRNTSPMSPDLHNGELPDEDGTLEQIQLDMRLLLILTGMFVASLLVSHDVLRKRNPGYLRIY